MSFKILLQVDGEDVRVLHEIDDRRVTRVGIGGRNGETGGMRVNPDQTEVLITLESAIVDGRPNLADVEAVQNPQRSGDEADAAIAEMSNLPSATNRGTDHILEASVRREGEVAQASESEAKVSEPDTTLAPDASGISISGRVEDDLVNEPDNDDDD